MPVIDKAARLKIHWSYKPAYICSPDHQSRVVFKVENAKDDYTNPFG
jgi:hypothetical protein